MGIFRLLRADEIDCRVSQIRKNGLQLLLYKNARTDMDILDETFGPLNWQRRHTRDNANCIVSIWDADKHQWIEKEDTGTESNTEAEKGLASDSFKRACVNIGIGRELYTAPFIWITPPNCEIKDDNGKYKCSDRFEVKEIGYNDNREINRLVIINTKTHNVAYEFGRTSPDGQKGTVQRTTRSGDEVIDQAPKAAQNGTQRVSGPSSKQKATDEQRQWIIDHASDEQYTDLMQRFGAELENLSANQAAIEITAIEKANDMTVRCERCDKAITGVALPDGKLMTATDLIAKSKLNYNGTYCLACMKELAKAQKRKAG